MSLPPLSSEFDDREEPIHPVLTMLLILAASGLGWALIFAVLFMQAA